VRSTNLYLVPCRSFGAAPQRQGWLVLRTVALGINGPGLREQGTADGRMERSGPAIQQHTRRHAERRRKFPVPHLHGTGSKSQKFLQRSTFSHKPRRLQDFNTETRRVRQTEGTKRLARQRAPAGSMDEDARRLLELLRPAVERAEQIG
jgi:hypothetical protein